MEFSAYPKSPKGGKSLVWQVQNMFHSGDSMVLPGALLLAASVVVLYEHMTNANDTQMRNFLSMIIVTMLPLAVLERKIFSCSDPVGALCKFSTKVLLMHLFFLVGHVLHGIAETRSMYALGSMCSNTDLCCLLTLCILLPTVFGFRFSRKFMCDHLDVWCMLLLTCLFAASTEALTMYGKGMLGRAMSSAYVRKTLLLNTLETASLYIELLAFVPAIWTVCRGSKDVAATKSVDIEGAKKRAVCFLTFLLAFYVAEDLFHGIYQNWSTVLVTLGHTAHFLLFLDFAAFLLAHFYDSEKFEKLIAPLMNLFADTSLV
jgi:hypothetical protein